MAPLRSDGGTQVGSIRTLLRTSPRDAFCDKQRMMASAVIEERRPGLFVFAAHHRYGHVARLWLEASAQPRAGTIGRHDAVDLALPLDDALSLRHLLFVVRRAGQGVQFQAVDLETSNGLQLESGQAARLVEASGPLILCASDFLFFCVPTGQPLPWDRDSRDPWGSLRPRLVSRQVGADFECSEPIAGWVTTQTELGERVVSFGDSALRAGVLIGRDARCDVVVPVQSVSRVHAVLLSLDDGLWVLDAGSTNGTWRLDQDLKIALVLEGDRLGLGHEASFGWRAAH